MKAKLFFGIVALFAVFTNCDRTENFYVLRVNPHHLALNDIYSSSSVDDYLFDVQELNIDSVKAISKQLYLKGIKAYKNDKDPLEAKVLLKRSLLVLPTANTYFEIGNAITEMATSPEDFREALNAYNMAGHLNFKPNSVLNYKKAVAKAGNVEDRYDEMEVLRYLTEAVDAGFRDTLLFAKGKLSSICSYSDYKVFMQEIRAVMSNKKVSPFEVFISSFPLISSGKFEITPQHVNMSDYGQSISYSYLAFIPEMENVSFGRDVSHEFLYVAALPSNDRYKAVIYATVGYFGGGSQPVYTKLVTYDYEGKQIAAKVFAGQFSSEKIKSGVYDNGKFTVTEYNRIWTLPIDKVPFEENTVSSYEEKGSATFVINDDGTIREEQIKGGFKDTLLLVKQ